MVLALIGAIFTICVGKTKPKFKPEIDFDDLAPGLNIDLGYYLTDDQLVDLKRKRRKKEELAHLLTR